MTIDYSKGKIYVIRNHINELVYVGSTTRPLSERMNEHRRHAKDRGHLKIYQAMNELLNDNFYIELFEPFSCSNKEELLKREGQVIRQLDSFKNGYNKVLCGRTQKEWDNDNAEKLKALKEDIHFAYWLAQMVPIYDPQNYFKKFLSANYWIKEYLPNFSFQTQYQTLVLENKFLSIWQKIWQVMWRSVQIILVWF